MKVLDILRLGQSLAFSIIKQTTQVMDRRGNSSKII